MIRLYPAPFEWFRGENTIRKYSWIKVSCRKHKDMQNRKETYKINKDRGPQVIDTSLCSNKGRTPWVERYRYIRPLISNSIEELDNKKRLDRTSLGIIRVHELLDFTSSLPLNDLERQRTCTIQETLFGDRRTKLEKLPHIFRYKFRCSPDCPKVHDMTVEDWELFQSFRSWDEKAKDREDLWRMMKNKYLEQFKEKDLHFFLGTHRQWGTWMIIGVYYQPKIESTSLFQFDPEIEYTSDRIEKSSVSLDDF